MIKKGSVYIYIYICIYIYMYIIKYHVGITRVVSSPDSFFVYIYMYIYTLDGPLPIISSLQMNTRFTTSTRPPFLLHRLIRSYPVKLFDDPLVTAR